ncbi:16S rRNA (guanine(966)-N(2))-methyltransferase RsmD [Alkalibaculum bacchi]|uniref:16S rRNA (Guanine(966)-N(2))-methyltransferase RsmD n=1 Tax=Alkalibaculum bacchi TaxID=645887 RepID=A0A366IBY3_9FIRM|nr:16S rRNA (guanine(966)-N(2))-methyltransferase RsmD [Alkalibaculum bacchi]RBP68287.1 16S rRNA (guanine(966)-N(2))-methyltransferase RsmD [Alkalibaculum bacchi]
MRVITGTAKGKKLLTPKDERVRPTTDRIKETLFNIINPYIRDAVIIDCFAGTGGVGIEALSRGARQAYFIDNHRESIKLIRKNLEIARLEEKGVVLPVEASSALTSLANKNVKADIIFMDPPYHLNIISRLVEIISQNNLLAEDGIIIAEHDNRIELKDQIERFAKVDQRVYGTTIMSYYKEQT